MSRRLCGRKSASREREGGELLASFVADFDLVTDWVFFREIRGRTGTEDEVAFSLRAAQFVSCATGTLAWSVIASDGRILDQIWRTVRALVFYVVRPVLLLAAFAIPSAISLLATAVAGGVLRASTSLFGRASAVSRWTARATDSSTGLLRYLMDAFRERASRSLSPILYRLEDGLSVSSGGVLLLGVMLEDLPQVVITFLVEDTEGGGLQNVSSTALLNLLLSAFDILSKIAEAWDTRADIITEGRGEYARKIRHGAPLRALAVTSDGRTVVAADETDVGALLVWDANAADGDAPRRVAAAGDAVRALAPVGLRSVVVVGSDDGTAAVVDLAAKDDDARVVAWRHPDAVVAVAARPNDPTTIVATGCADGGTRLFRATENSTNAFKVLGDASGVAVACLAFSDDGDAIVSIAVNSRATVWRVRPDDDRSDDLLVINSFVTHRRPVRVVVAATSERFLTGSDDGTAKLWSVGTGRCARTYRRRGHRGPVRALALVDERRRFLSAGADATIRLWNIDAAVCEHVFRGSGLSVNDVRARRVVTDDDEEESGRASSSCNEFVSCSDDATIRFWSLEGCLEEDDDEEEQDAVDEDVALVEPERSRDGSDGSGSVVA